MELSPIEHIVYGFISGLTEILPVSARAHSILMLKVLGAEKINGIPALLIHIAMLAALYASSQIQIVKMSRARRLARIPKRKRKRPLDIRSLMDLRFWYTMIIPVVLMLLIYGRFVVKINFSLLALSALMAANGVILYIPQFLPGSNKDARSLSRIEGFLMGLGGSLSVFPGLSGTGAALSAGSICGVERSYALNMTLLLDMVYVAGMILFDILQIVSAGLGGLTFAVLIYYILAAFAAFVSTMIGIRIMRSLAAGAGFSFFSYYCWGAALFAFILNLMA